MSLPTFTAAFIRVPQKHTVLPLHKVVNPTEVVLPMGLKVTIMHEDGNQVVIRFNYKKSIYQAVIPQDSLMIDYRMLGMEV